MTKLTPCYISEALTYVYARLVDLDLDAMSQSVGKGKQKNQRRLMSTTKQAISFKLATTVGRILHDFDFENRYMA